MTTTAPGSPRRRRRTPLELVQQHSAGRSAGFLLWHASLRWQRRLSEVLSPMGITTVQFSVVSTVWWLGKDGFPPRQREVSEHAGLDPAMTSQVMTVAIDRGWILRRVDPEDARASLLYVTDLGRDIAQRAVVELDRADQEFFAEAGDRDEVLAMLRVLAARDERGASRDRQV